MREVGAAGSAKGTLRRRRFLKFSVTATAGVLGLQALATRGEGNSITKVLDRSIRPVKEIIMLDRVSVSVFEACLGDAFRARTSDGKVLALELIEAKAAEPRPGLSAVGIREDPFSLWFRATTDLAIGQGLYTIEHSRLGRFDLFMGPVGFRRPSDPIVLEAAFG